MASGGVASPTDRLTNLQFSEAELKAIVEEARNDANRIREQARQQAIAMMESSEVMKMATAQANELIRNAEVEASEIRKGADDYAVTVLSNLETVMTNAIGTVRRGRESFEQSRSGE